MDQYNPWGNPEPSRAKERARELRQRWSGPALGGVILALILLWGLTGIYQVGPGQMAVVRQFGKVKGMYTSGLHFRLPYPIQTHNIVDVEEERRAEIGFRSERVGRSLAGNRPDEALMLTGDENIVEVNLIVQYRVSDPAAFLFNVRSPEETLHAAAEVALRSVIGRNPIDSVISGGAERTQQQLDVQDYLQNLLDLYGTGLRVTQVGFTLVDAPIQVRDAFHDVIRAYEERERKVNEAMAYRADIVPRARGEAQQILRQAEAFREERVRRASGDAARFTQMLAEYKVAPDITRQRMYLEAIEKIMPDAQKFIMSGDTDGVLPFLPLSALNSQGGR